MIAIVVGTMSIVGTVILNSPPEPPAGQTSSFSLAQNGSAVTIYYTGHDTVDGENLYVYDASGNKVGNYAGTDGQACHRTIDTVDGGTKCRVSGLSSSELSLVWRDGSSSDILYESVVNFIGTTTTTTATPTTTTTTATPTTTTTPTTDDPPAASIDDVADNSCEYYNDNSGQCKSNSNSGPTSYVEYRVDWSASDDNGIGSVSVELVDSSGAVVDSAAPSASGSSSSGTVTLSETGGYGDQYTIEVTVTDTEGQTDTVSRSDVADGSDP